MEIQTVQEIMDASGKQKVIIYRRPSRTYYFEEWHFSEEAREMNWIPLRLHAIGFYDTAGTALREAMGYVSWLKPTD